MEKKENLRKNVQDLCEILNENKFTNHGFKWDAGSDPRSTFGGGICFNKEAFHFLQKNGYLNRDICWKCGEGPISNKYSFTFNSAITYKICASCYGIGKNIQKPSEGVGSKNCYIATVCYEDIDAPEVEQLRNFRDNYLALSPSGIKFIDFYYRISPKIASWMENKKILNKAVKVLLLNPIIKKIKS